MLPYPLGNIHPRFWGWVIGTGTPIGALAEMLAAGMNPNVGGGEHIAQHVELQVIDWCKEMLGYPAEASGLLVSGGSMANLVGLDGRAQRAAPRSTCGERGCAAAPRRMVFYASTETHNSVQKAAGLLGLGTRCVRTDPGRRRFRDRRRGAARRASRRIARRDSIRSASSATRAR